MDPDTVDDPICRQLLDTYRAAGVLVAIWDATSDIGLPVFRVSIIDAEADPLRRLPAAAGFGCHLARGVALSRALTEAAQSRLTLIAGSRDDAPPSLYLDHRDTDAIEQQLTLMRDRPTPADFTDTPTIELHDVADDVTHTIDALRSRGLNQIVMVDLTRPETAVPVVRMVIPGLEGYAEKVTDYVAGRRAMEVAGQR